MENAFPTRILVVDDESSTLERMKCMLESKGCNVLTAADGFAALKLLRRILPDLIISDLRMPNMSGFELLAIVRRRFPHIPVMAISGEFILDGSPPGLLVDVFLQKGAYTADEMFRHIEELVAQAPIRPHLAKSSKAPLWIPRRDVGYIVATCTECLRSFSIDDESTSGELRKAECAACGTVVEYLVDAAVLKMLEGKKLKTA